jgi:hypothetical protein
VSTASAGRGALRVTLKRVRRASRSTEALSGSGEGEAEDLLPVGGRFPYQNNHATVASGAKEVEKGAHLRNCKRGRRINDALRAIAHRCTIEAARATGRYRHRYRFLAVTPRDLLAPTA